jgi:hypothetical protein
MHIFRLNYSFLSTPPVIIFVLRRPLTQTTISGWWAFLHNPYIICHKSPISWVLPTYFLPLYGKLREERFVPDDLDKALLTLSSARLNYCRSQILYTLNDTFIVDFSHKVQLFVITERGVESLRLLKSNLFADRRKMFNSTPPYTGAYTNHHFSILLYWLFSWICRKRLGSIWTFNAPRTQRYKDRCVALSQDNHTCDVSFPSTMNVYVSQRKESFSGEKIRMCGVSISTNHPILCNEVFNYSGMHSLFDAVAIHILLCWSHFSVPLVVCYLSMARQAWVTWRHWATGRFRGGKWWFYLFIHSLFLPRL